MFPAGAGMNRINDHRRSYFCYVPRWRGDEPERHEIALAEDLCSPLARG